MDGDWIKLIGRVYDEINIALWAGLLSFLLFFSIVLLPQLKEGRSAYEARLAGEISSESDFYCRRFMFAPGTNAYRSCLDDLGRLRTSVEKRIAADLAF